MGFQRNFLYAALGLHNVLGVQSHWMGRMADPNGLDTRQLKCPDGFVGCGNLGCMAQSRCCNPIGEWSCFDGDACYTASSTVDCYVATEAVPKKARSCFDYTQTGCADADVGCFQCASTDSPYCYTEVRAGVTNLGCYVSPAVITTISTTPAASSTPARPGTTPPGSQITPGPSMPVETSGNPSPPSTPKESSGLSGGAIAGIAIGAFAAIAIIGALAFLLWRKSRKEPQAEHLPIPLETTQYPPQYQQGAEMSPAGQHSYYGKADNHYPQASAPGQGPAELESGVASTPAELGS